MDFEYYAKKLVLNTPARIKSVDDGFFYLALLFGIFSAVITIAMFVLATITCCSYVQCRYFFPLLCGLMPFLIGVFGMMVSVSIASLSAMTRFRYSFLYNVAGWWIFFPCLASFLFSFGLMGGFFYITCRHERNSTVDKDATYPADGYFGERHRADPLGTNFWNCKQEFCILMWLNLVITTPVFVLILVNVSIARMPNHNYPFPSVGCGSHLIHRRIGSSASFVSLSSFHGEDSEIVADVNSSSDSNTKTHPLSNSHPHHHSHLLGQDGTSGGNTGWAKFGNENDCIAFRKSAEDYLVGVKRPPIYTAAACAKLLSRTMPPAHPHAPSSTSASEGQEASSFSFSSSSSLSSASPSSSSFASLTLTDTLVEMADRLDAHTQHADSHAQHAPTTASMSSASTGALSVAVYTSTPTASADVVSVSNADDVCHDYTLEITSLKEEIETWASVMVVVAGYALLVPGAPVALTDGIVAGIIFTIAMIIYGWLAAVFAYYFYYCLINIICHMLCTRTVTDSVEDHGDVIVEHYHVEDNTPDIPCHCCICCDLPECMEIVKNAVIVVLACLLSDSWCGMSFD